ncbi:hypothetical protein KKB43_06250 [Patescibacteria group bacterium]|nr:hypothetical protein [Patescibacteria group bacterium]MBU4580581.1 hypothetical protein [Patescibacteria group bacterium]
MFSNKNLFIALSLILFLIIGAVAGYFMGINNAPSVKPIIINNPIVDNSTKLKTLKTEIIAKEAYDIALSESRLWPEDAYLSGIELISKKFNEKGFSNGWKTMFYSKSKNKTYEVTIKDGESRGTIEKEALSPLQTLKGEMIDSAMLAKSFYGLYPADTEIISLKMYYDAGSKKFLWTIFFPKGSHTIDAEI